MVMRFLSMGVLNIVQGVSEIFERTVIVAYMQYVLIVCTNERIKVCS